MSNVLRPSCAMTVARLTEVAVLPSPAWAEVMVITLMPPAVDNSRAVRSDR